MRFALISLLLVAGCRDLLGIDDAIDRPIDAAIVSEADAPLLPDADLCGLADYDSDGVNDGCDPCPQLANKNEDTDGDGVGDACDPNPASPGDKRLLWTTFDQAADIATWTVSGGTWTVGTTGLTQTSTNGTATITVPTVVHDLYVAAAMHVVSTASDAVINLCMAGTGQSEVCCEVTASTDGLETFGGAGGTSAGGFTDGLNGLVGHVTGTTVYCGIVHTASTTETIKLTRPSAPSGKVSLRTTKASMRYDYLFIAGVP